MVLPLLLASILAPPAVHAGAAGSFVRGPDLPADTDGDTANAHTLRLLTESGQKPYMSSPYNPENV